MAGITDLAFRSVCADMGADHAVSEMVSAKAMFYLYRYLGVILQ